MAVVRLAADLRRYAGGQSAVTIEGATLGDVLASLEAQFPAVGKRVRDERGRLRRHVNVFVGIDRVVDQAARLEDGCEVSILPAVSGG